jgi:hypothetical protein
MEEIKNRLQFRDDNTTSMKICLTICLITVTVLSAYAQSDKRHLSGDWICENNDSSYYTNEYVTLYNDSAFKNRSNQCNFLEWAIKGRR